VRCRRAVAELLPGLVAAAIEGLAALGECGGQRDGRVGRDRSGVQQAPRVKGPLCAEAGIFAVCRRVGGGPGSGMPRQAVPLRRPPGGSRVAAGGARRR